MLTVEEDPQVKDHFMGLLVWQTAALVIGWDSGAPLNHKRIAGQSQWVGRHKVYGDFHGSLTDIKRVSGFRRVAV
ncbi:hypothetical protein EYF80_023862 [Liparis tanakae]|uniref:Uncharacterized protein n=1 Tax=Liparis tanakae TaxID=230148 RepID=A0A4Z2HM44_9TELE|nr:hypothetical protein EYF80_023862 [Liparis tanakae]